MTEEDMVLDSRRYIERLMEKFGGYPYFQDDTSGEPLSPDIPAGFLFRYKIFLVRGYHSITPLDDREYKILQRRIGVEGEYRSAAEVAREEGIPERAVRDLEENALDKLKEMRVLLNDLFLEHIGNMITLGRYTDKGPIKFLYRKLQEAEEKLRPYEQADLKEKLGTKIEYLDLSGRAYCCLKNKARIRTVRELVEKTEENLLSIYGFGRGSLNEVKDLLRQMGLSLGMRFPEEYRAGREEGEKPEGS